MSASGRAVQDCVGDRRNLALIMSSWRNWMGDGRVRAVNFWVESGTSACRAEAEKADMSKLGYGPDLPNVNTLVLENADGD